MSTSRHARSRNPRAARASRPEGLSSAAEEVTWAIHHSGWSSPIGKASFSVSLEETLSEKGPIFWQKWSSPRLDLSRTAYLFILQGMQLGQLFDHGCWIESGNSQTLGPFLFLKGRNDFLLAAQPVLYSVVLGQAIEVPEALSMQELLGLLLTTVLGG